MVTYDSLSGQLTCDNDTVANAPMPKLSGGCTDEVNAGAEDAAEIAPVDRVQQGEEGVREDVSKISPRYRRRYHHGISMFAEYPRGV